MKTRILAMAVSSVLILAISACSLPGSKTNTNRKPDMALTVTAQALIIQNSTNQAATKQPIIRTPHPRNTPGAALTSTPGAPTVSVSSPTNCRTGPSTDYDLLYTLNVGETVEVVGKYSGGNYWVINNPDGGGNCWLWGEYATITGNTDNLPDMVPPPAPKVHPKKPTPTDTAAVPASDSNSGSSSGSSSNPSSNPNPLIPIPPNVIKALTSPPSAPSSLTVSTNCTHNVFTGQLLTRFDNLSWPSVDRATGYYIYKDGAKVLTLAMTSMVFPNITTNTTIWGVAAYNSFGASGITLGYGHCP